MSVAYDLPPRVRRVRPQAPAVVLPFPGPVAVSNESDDLAVGREEVALVSPAASTAGVRHDGASLGAVPGKSAAVRASFDAALAPVSYAGAPVDYADVRVDDTRQLVDDARRLVDGSRVAGDLRGPVACPSSRPAGELSVRDLAAPDTRVGRLRLTARGRRLRALLCACALVAAGWITVSAIHSAVSSPVIPSSAPAAVRVHPGDTLWSIATRIAPQQDPRRVVAALRSANHLDSNTVRVGQQLRVPH